MIAPLGPIIPASIDRTLAKTNRKTRRKLGLWEGKDAFDAALLTFRLLIRVGLLGVAARHSPRCDGCIAIAAYLSTIPVGKPVDEWLHFGYFS
jgi:hypothetical protein